LSRYIKALLPKLVAQPLEHFRAALDCLLVSDPPRPLSPSEILVALHDVDPARDAVPLKRIIESCSECFERPAAFPAEALAAALQKMVEYTPLPLLFMRTAGDNTRQLLVLITPEPLLSQKLPGVSHRKCSRQA
jgi:symplekin